MNVTIMRQVKFCAGHRLVGHEGKCANLHGHNYLAQIFVTGAEFDNVGRVVDFSVINKLFKGWIDEHWDHGILVWDEDTPLLDALTHLEPSKIYCLPYNPTAENIAKYLLTEVGPKLVEKIDGYDVQLSKVIVWETENACAELSLNDSAETISTRLHSGHAET